MSGLTENSSGQTERVKQALENAKAAARTPPDRRRRAAK